MKNIIVDGYREYIKQIAKLLINEQRIRMIRETIVTQCKIYVHLANHLTESVVSAWFIKAARLFSLQFRSNEVV